MISKAESKFIKSLKLKKFRTKERKFIVEGRKNILELLDSKLRVARLFGTRRFEDYLRQENKSVDFEPIAPKELESLGSYVTNDFALAVVHIPESSADLEEEGPIILLDGINDPGNLGTIARTMDWFGFRNLICSSDCAEFYNPKTITSSMGSFGRINPYYTDLVEYVSGFPNHNKYGLVLGGELMGRRMIKNGIYILGSESHGIRPELRAQLSHQITIKGKGDAESLNVAIAAGILFHKISET